MKLPLEKYVAALTRTRYLAAAAPSLTGFQPDGRTIEYMVSLPGVAQALYGALVQKFNAANAASGILSTCFDDCHDLSVAVYTSLKTSYRNDPNCTKCIRSLPKHDRTTEKTLFRMKSIAALWPTLPNVPGTDGPLKVGATTAADFVTKTDVFDEKVSAASLADAEYSRELAHFHQELDTLDSFVTSALIQGRVLYKPGTPERALIDRVPTAPDTQAPGQAVITLAQSPGAGQVDLEFNAPSATSFQVWHKGPGEEQFTQVADILLPGTYTVRGLAGGQHEYKVVPINSRGEGQSSEVATLQVAQAVAA